MERLLDAVALDAAAHRAVKNPFPAGTSHEMQRFNRSERVSPVFHHFGEGASFHPRDRRPVNIVFIQRIIVEFPGGLFTSKIPEDKIGMIAKIRFPGEPACGGVMGFNFHAPVTEVIKNNLHLHLLRLSLDGPRRENQRQQKESNEKTHKLRKLDGTDQVFNHLLITLERVRWTSDDDASGALITRTKKTDPNRAAGAAR